MLQLYWCFSLDSSSVKFSRLFLSGVHIYFFNFLLSTIYLRLGYICLWESSYGFSLCMLLHCQLYKLFYWQSWCYPPKVHHNESSALQGRQILLRSTSTAGWWHDITWYLLPKVSCTQICWFVVALDIQVRIGTEKTRGGHFRL